MPPITLENCVNCRAAFMPSYHRLPQAERERLARMRQIKFCSLPVENQLI